MKRIFLLIAGLLFATFSFSQTSYQASIYELLEIQEIPKMIQKFTSGAVPPKGSIAEKTDQEYEDRLIAAITDTTEALIMAEIAEIVAQRYSEKEIKGAVLAEKSSGEEGYFLDMPSFLADKIDKIGQGFVEKVSQEMVEGMIQEVHDAIQAERKEKFAAEYKKCNPSKKGKFVSNWVGEKVVFDLKEGKIIELDQDGEERLEFAWLSKCRFSLNPKGEQKGRAEEQLGALIFNMHQCEKERFQYLAKFEKQEMIFIGEMRRKE